MKNSHIGNYSIIQEIGRGATSIVYLARNHISSEICCVKVIKKSGLENKDDIKFFKREILILSSINHENIVKFYELIEDSTSFYLFMEYCAGESLQKIIEMNNGMNENIIKIVLKQILSGLSYLHCNEIAHRDIKPDNIIISSNFKVKIVDFGLSTNDSSNLRTTFCGSLAFAAPECISREPYNATFADIWSAGVCLYMMSTGKLPWKTSNMVILMKQITSSNFIIPKEINKDLENILIKMLQRDPNNRLSAFDLLKENYFIEPNTQKPHIRNPRLSSKIRISSPII